MTPKQYNQGKQKGRWNEAGFSFAEFIVSMGLGVIVMSAVFSLDVLAKQSFTVNSGALDIHAGARNAMDWLTRDIRWASQVVSSKVIGGTTYASATNELVLEMPSIDVNGDIIEGTSDFVAYRVITSGSNKKLQRVVLLGTGSYRNANTRDLTLYLDATTPITLYSGGTAVTSVADKSTVSQLQVTLNAKKKTISNSNVIETLASVVELRNKSEL